MPQNDLSQAALVLLGHGSTKNMESAAPIFQHAAELRRRGIFREVYEAFWKQEPQVKKVLPQVKAPRTFIVPLFISEGYFSDDVIPKELGFLNGPRVSTQTSTLYYCRAVGTHPSMTAVILARAREVMEKFPFPRLPKAKDTTLFIAGHGTKRNENSRAAIDHQVEAIRALNVFADVQTILMEEDPLIGSCYQAARTKNIVIVPFFISDGMHTQEDIPVMLGEPKRIVEQRIAAGQPTWRNPTERNEKLVWYTPSVGTDPHIVDVILERVHEMENL